MYCLDAGRDCIAHLERCHVILRSSGGQLVIGRNLGGLAITGNLVVQPSGSGLAVDGALESMTVAGCTVS